MSFFYSKTPAEQAYEFASAPINSYKITFNIRIHLPSSARCICQLLLTDIATPGCSAHLRFTGLEPARNLPVLFRNMPLTPRFSYWYQTMLLYDRGRRVWTTCSESLLSRAPAGDRTRDLLIACQRFWRYDLKRYKMWWWWLLYCPTPYRKVAPGTKYVPVEQQYIRWQWRNFVPYLCQLVFGAIL